MKRKERKLLEEKVLHESKVVKLLFSEVPVGSIFFGDEDIRNFYMWEKYIIKNKLGDFEQPTIERAYSRAYIRYPTAPATQTVGLYKFVSYDDIVEFGFDDCLNNGTYKILDLNYIEHVKAIREAKTIKELKEVLEKGLR